MSYYEHDDALRSILRRSRILKVDDSGSQQLVDLMNLAGDMPKKVYRQQRFGLSANPPINSEGYVAALGGRSDRLIFLDGEHKDHRPTGMGAGETVLYDAYGKTIKVQKDQTTFDAGGKPVTIKNATIIKVEGTSDVSFGVGSCWVHIAGGKVHLGVSSATDTATAAVETTAGPSSIVFAKV